MQPLHSTLVSIDYGKKSDCLVTLKCGRILFEILLDARAPRRSIEADFLRRLDEIGDDEDQEEILFEELSNLLASTCQPLFQAYCFETEAPQQPRTLSSLVKKEIVDLSLVTVNGTPQVRLRSKWPRIQEPGAVCKDDLGYNQVHVYRSCDIEPQRCLKANSVFQVLVDGQILCAKLIGQHSSRSILREITLLQRITSEDIHSSIRIPRLRGLISSDTDHTQIIGFVMTYIRSGRAESHLGAVDVRSVPYADRVEWATQIREGLALLHSRGIVWGDAKADNIMLDIESRLWMTDFGGGYTQNWVDALLAESMKGDLQGLARILRFLKL